MTVFLPLRPWMADRATQAVMAALATVGFNFHLPIRWFAALLRVLYQLLVTGLPVPQST